MKPIYIASTPTDKQWEDTKVHEKMHRGASPERIWVEKYSDPTALPMGVEDRDQTGDPHWVEYVRADVIRDYLRASNALRDGTGTWDEAVEKLKAMRKMMGDDSL